MSFLLLFQQQPKIAATTYEKYSRNRPGGRNFDRNFCGWRAATYVAKMCCYMMRTRALAYASEIIFWKNVDFVEKSEKSENSCFWQFNLKHMLGWSGCQKFMWKQHCCFVAGKQQFCCRRATDVVFGNILNFETSKILKWSENSVKAEISTEISAGGRAGTYVAVSCALARLHMQARACA